MTYKTQVKVYTENTYSSSLSSGPYSSQHQLVDVKSPRTGQSITVVFSDFNKIAKVAKTGIIELTSEQLQRLFNVSLPYC